MSQMFEPQLFESIEYARLQELHFRFDEESGLRAIIAIHNTRLGPALGGCRFIEYERGDAALADAIRLARGMSYKAALADIPQGGGKAVILKPAQLRDREALFTAFGRFVHELDGRYITAVDSGTLLEDMDNVSQVTPFVSGTNHDGLDPSPMTAAGVYAGIEAAVRFKLKRQDLKGLSIAVQGVGNVGFSLARMLHEAGARLLIADRDATRVQRCVSDFDATAVPVNQILATECDVLAPCGLGGILNAESIALLRCQIVAGSANNQLADDAQGEALHRKGVLYAPDYVINAGGLITVSLGYHKIPADVIRQRTHALGRTLTRLFERSQADNLPPEQIANRMAEEKLYG